MLFRSYWVYIVNVLAIEASLNQAEYKDTLAGALVKRGLYGQNINNVDPINNALVRKAEAAGAAILDKDGTILSAGQARKPEVKAPKGDWFETKPGIEEYHEWTPKKGWIPTGKTRSRWKPERAISPKDIATAENTIRDDAHKIAQAEVKRTIPGSLIFDSASGTYDWRPNDPARANQIYEARYRKYFEEVRKRYKKYGYNIPPLTNLPTAYEEGLAPSRAIPKIDPLGIRK